MNPEIWARFLEIVPIGFFSGLLAGAFGVGGGIISVPLLRHLLGLTAHEAVGCSLAMILPTALIGVFNYLKQGKTQPKLSLLCSLPAVVGTTIASAVSHYVHGRVLMLLLALLMVLVGIDFVTGFANKYKAAKSVDAAQESGSESVSEAAFDSTKASEPQNQSGSAKSAEPEYFEWNRKNIFTAGVIGLFVGLLSGLLGIGGGFIMVPAFCYLLSLPLKVAFGTSLIVVALVALPGTIVHSLHQHVHLWVVLPMLAGSLPGAWLGSYFSLKAKDRSLRIVFGTLLLILAVIFAHKELTS